MSMPHRGGGRARSRARRIGVTMGMNRGTAPGKRNGFKFPCGSCQCSAEVILGVRVPPRKPRTAAAQNGGDLWSGRATPEQFLGDPFIGDAPVGLWEALGNPQPVQPTGIRLGRGGGRARCVDVRGYRQRKVCGQRQVRVDQTALGRLQKSGALGSDTGLSVQYLHPRRVTAPVAPLWFLIGETSQAAQMAPIGTGAVATVEVGQLFPDAAGNSRFDGRGTDLHPGLNIAGTGLEYYAGPVTCGPHGLDNCQAGVIQIDEDVSRIALPGVRLDVYVTAFPIADAQKSYGSRVDELDGGPQPLTRERPLGGAVNQADQVKVARHGHELAAHSLQGEVESTVEHGPHFGIEGTRRTMNSQRTANSGLTGCLSLGVHRTACSSK